MVIRAARIGAIIIELDSVLDYKDLTLNGMGDAKRATATEYEAELARTKELIHKQKVHWFS